VVSGTPCGPIMKTKRRAGSVGLEFFETIDARAAFSVHIS
jgi:hypothetical protein